MDWKGGEVYRCLVNEFRITESYTSINESIKRLVLFKYMRYEVVEIMSNNVFIGACFPPEILNELIKEDNIADLPANIFGWKIVKGLVDNGVGITVINEHKMPKFPKKRRLLSEEKKFIYQKVYFRCYRYLNISMLEKISKAISIEKELRKIRPKEIFVYSMHTPYLLPAVRYAKKYKSKIILIVPDLPEHMLGAYGFLLKTLKRIDGLILTKLRKYVDGYVLLSKYMAEELDIPEEQYIVVEGIADECKDENREDVIEKKDYILYSGAVSSRYGLSNFVESFLKASIPYQFWVCGSGDYVPVLKELSEKHSNIRYLGVVNRVELAKLQKEAVLLINPRSEREEYTKYSFPSKTMEYLLSSTPTMMEHLRGIPEEYFNYIITVKEGNWILSLREFYKLNDRERAAIGKKGHDFVVTEKNMTVQTKKIETFVRGLYENEQE